MKRFLACYLLMISTSACFAEDAVLTFPTTGYQIKVRDPGPAGEHQFVAFTLFMSPQDNFASNINVMHQPFPGTLREYQQVSEEELKKMSYTILRSEIKEDAYVCEALGKPQGVNFEVHMYFKAISVGGNVVLATASIPASRWEADRLHLIPQAESLAPMKRK